MQIWCPSNMAIKEIWQRRNHHAREPTDILYTKKCYFSIVEHWIYFNHKHGPQFSNNFKYSFKSHKRYLTIRIKIGDEFSLQFQHVMNTTLTVKLFRTVRKHVFFFLLVAPHDLWDFSFLTRDWTWVLSSWESRVLTTADARWNSLRFLLEGQLLMLNQKLQQTSELPKLFISFNNFHISV